MRSRTPHLHHQAHALRGPIEQIQDAVFARADQAAGAADRVVTEMWGRILELITAAAGPTSSTSSPVPRIPPPWFVVHRAAIAILRDLHDLPGVIAGDLAEVVRYAHRATAGAVDARLPDPHREALSVAATTLQRGQLLEAEGDPEPAPEPLIPTITLFPPPTVEQVQSIVYATDWQDRLRSLTRLASPDVIASTVATAAARGDTPTAIAQQIRPLVDNVRTSARRVARTEGMRVAHAEQLEMYEQLGPLLIGYQVHSQKVHSTRWWHRKRDLTIYYKEPRPGSDQKGMHQCPHPPDEPADPAERPPGTPQTAPNCLCWLTPVLADPSAAG